MSGETPEPPTDNELPKDPLLDLVTTHVDEAIAADDAQAGEVVEPAETRDTTAAKHVDVQHIADDAIPETVIQDKDKALDVAYASKGQREYEAKSKDKARSAQESEGAAYKLADTVLAIEKEIRDLKDEYYRKKGSHFIDREEPEAIPIFAKETELEQLKDLLEYSDDKRIQDIPYGARKEIRNFRHWSPDVEEGRKRIAEYIEEEVRKNQESARGEARTAEAIEKWAGFLYDHPVSDEYKKAHPDHKFEPDDLMYLEQIVTPELEDIKLLEEAITDAPVTVGIDGLNEQKYMQYTRMMEWGSLSPVRVMRSAYGRSPRERVQIFGAKGEVISEVIEDKPPKSEAWEQYLTMVEDPNTTLGQLRDIYIKAFRKAHIEPKKRWAEPEKAILDDIRSGRASEK